MTTIYLAQYAFNGDEDSMRDDASDWENGASPMCVSVALELTDAWVNSLKSSIEKEYSEYYGEGEAQPVVSWNDPVSGKDGIHDAWIHTMNVKGMKEHQSMLVIHEREQWDTEH